MNLSSDAFHYLKSNPPDPAQPLVFQHFLHIWVFPNIGYMILRSHQSHATTTITKGANIIWCSRKFVDETYMHKIDIFENKHIDIYDSPKFRAFSRTTLICPIIASSIKETVLAGRKATRQWILSFRVGFLSYIGSSSLIGLTGLNWRDRSTY